MTIFAQFQATNQLLAELEAVAPGEFSRHDATTIRINEPAAQFIQYIGVREEWSNHPGRMRFYITIGEYGNRKTFKRSKYTGWPAQAIADFVRTYCKQAIEQTRREAANSNLRIEAMKIQDAIGSDFVRIDHVPGDEATVYLTYRRAVSKGAAAELAAYLKVGGYL